MWTPSRERIESANMTAFLRLAAERSYIAPISEDILKSYHELWEWSVSDGERFWDLIREFGELLAEGDTEPVGFGLDRIAPPDAVIGPKWFPNLRLNFAENLLRHSASVRPETDRAAIIAWNEQGRYKTLTQGELRAEVLILAWSLRQAGVGPGDRVAGFLPNIPETVIAMLAATAVGAVWSSCSPDFGVQGVLDRFGQIEPKILFCADGYCYAGKEIPLLSRIKEIAQKLPTVEQVVVIPYRETTASLTGTPHAVTWDEFFKQQAAAYVLASPEYARLHETLKEGDETTLSIDVQSKAFARLPFDHPIYIMYSSGTTGLPKCMVHSAGGTLIQHLKEHLLHTDVKPDDKVFYFTTCGWMMWNWLASCLAVGSAIVLYDGAPMPVGIEDILWQMAEEEGITIFGTSAKYLALCEKSGLEPGKRNLSALRAILSTGSPLANHSFDYVYSNIKSDVHLASISGGTDIVSCFAGGNPIAPVYRGELQTRALGMAVDVYDEDGKPLRGAAGELVCTKSFPSMPVSFWNDPDGSKYRAAYFEFFPGVWRHGDWAEITGHDGMIIYGRSDATLNPGGVRIGTAEIYRQVERLPEVVESLAIGQDIGDAGDVRVVLFVRLREGLKLDDALRDKIRNQIRENTTPLHVPKIIVQVSDIPRTISGKISELAVRNVVHGRPVRNTEALANPESLELFRDLAELRVNNTQE
jgi:acetoacetyl-CoA synthetase